MQLDKTRIGIRARGAPEVLDLALHVVRGYLRPLILTMACGVLPLALLNGLLLRPLLADFNYADQLPVRYLWNMSLLVFLQAPLAGAVATAWLGQAVFMDRPRYRETARDVWRLLPRLLWIQGVMRGVLPALVLVLLIDRDASFSGAEFLLLMLAIYAALVRATRPFMNEIVLLERNPLTSRGENVITVARRSGMLHRSGGDSFMRWMSAAGVGVCLALSLAWSLKFASQILFYDWDWGPLMTQAFYPLALWTVAMFMNVVRFLNYLDLRIRQEGWEVELRLRAEAARLAARLT